MGVFFTIIVLLIIGVLMYFTFSSGAYDDVQATNLSLERLRSALAVKNLSEMSDEDIEYVIKLIGLIRNGKFFGQYIDGDVRRTITLDKGEILKNLDIIENKIKELGRYIEQQDT